MLKIILNWLGRRKIRKLGKRAADISADPYQRSLMGIMMLIASKANVDSKELFEASIGANQESKDYLRKVDQFSKMELMHLMYDVNDPRLSEEIEKIINKK